MNPRRRPASADQDPRSPVPLSIGATGRQVTEIGYRVEVVLSTSRDSIQMQNPNPYHITGR